MIRIAIKKNQVWRHRTSDFQVMICGKKRVDKWLVKVLTSKPGVFAGTHTFARNTIWSKFTLVP